MPHKCHVCDGEGEVYLNSETVRCYHCRGLGWFCECTGEPVEYDDE